MTTDKPYWEQDIAECLRVAAEIVGPNSYYLRAAEYIDDVEEHLPRQPPRSHHGRLPDAQRRLSDAYRRTGALRRIALFGLGIFVQGTHRTGAAQAPRHHTGTIKGGMMQDTGPIVVAMVALLAFGILVGSVISDVGWRSDCAKISAHVSDGKIFKCEEAKK